MSSLNPLSFIEEFTVEVESDFAFNQHATDPLKEFEDECLQSFGFISSHADFDMFNDLNDVSVVVYSHGDYPDSVSNKDCHPHAENAYAFEVGDVYELNSYKHFST